MAISEKLVKINEEVVAQEDLLAQIQAALEGKIAGGSAEGSIEVVKRTIELDSNSQTITIPDIEKEPKMLFLVRRVYISESTYSKSGNENYIDSDEYFVTSLLYNSNEDFSIKFELATYVEDYGDPTYYICYDDSKQNDKYIQYNETTKEIIIIPPDNYASGCLFILGSYECYILYDQASESNGIDTSDANATSLDMREGTSGYVNGVKIEGNVLTRSVDDVIVGDTSVTIPAGIYDEMIEKTISNNDASSFEWKPISYTPSTDDSDWYDFSIELKDDTAMILIKQYYKYSSTVTYTDYPLMYSDGDVIEPLAQASSIYIANSNATYGDLKIENNILYGSCSSNVENSEYALIPLESTGTSSGTKLETWVFTLEDGSTVEKEVAIGDSPSTEPTQNVLENMSWADIQTISKAGKAREYFSIGDQKTISIDGTNYLVDIIGFDHDAVGSFWADDYGREKAGITFQLHGVLDDMYQWNESEGNTGGWMNSDIRASGPWGGIPSDLKNVIINVSKGYGIGGGSNEIETSDEEDIFLLSADEVFGSISHNVVGEGTQYEYYTNGGSTIKYKNDGTVCQWWLRSPMKNSNTWVGKVNANGAESVDSETNYFGVSFGFCV